MNKRALKYKWLKTKMALHETMQHILEINRQRKRSNDLQACALDRNYDEELRVLNATAEIQSRAMKIYYQQLQQAS